MSNRIAIHEAGHAVMAFLCGRRLGTMSAVPHAEILGQLEYRGYPSFPARALDDARVRRKLEAEIMIAMAGLAAEGLHRRAVDRPGAVFDLQRALRIAHDAIGDLPEAAAYVNWLFLRARNRLRLPASRRATKTLAAALARRGTLSGAESRALLRRSIR